MYPFRVLNKRKYLMLYFNAILYNLCSYSTPIILSIFLVAPFTISNFEKLIILLIIFQVLERIFNIIWIMKGYSFVEYTKNKLYISYFKRLCNMSYDTTDKVHSGYLKSQFDIVVNEFGMFLDDMMLYFNGFCIGITLFLIQTFRQGIVIFLISIGIILIIIVYNYILSKGSVQVHQKYHNTLSKYNATLVDFIQNNKIVKNYNSIIFSIKKINTKFDNVKKPLDQVNAYSSLRFDGINFLIYFMYIIILINLLFKMKFGENVFTYVVFYTTIVGKLITELNGISRLFFRFTKLSSANKIIESTLKEKQQQNKIRNWNNITLKNIEFKYNEQTDSIINIPIFSIDRKDKISIVGESGQGKTTFLRLFSRFYKVLDDYYLTDNTPTSKIPDVAYISQETDLFNLSIKENLCLGKDISNKIIMEYLDAAGLSKWINSLENGIETIVGEKGIKLSTGQKQRLNIIRGILLDKDIYIIDEPTSNLDNYSEHKIYEMLNKYLKDKTIIIVTHSQNLTELCNKHYYFENHTLFQKNTL